MCVCFLFFRVQKNVQYKFFLSVYLMKKLWCIDGKINRDLEICFSCVKGLKKKSIEDFGDMV